MAIYLDIYKVAEETEHADFDFATTDGRRGSLRLNKVTGDVTARTPMLGDDKGAMFARAARKVGQAWQEGGALPEKLVWAS